MDAADEAKFAEAKEELHQLMAKPQLANIPLLVLGNKNDLPEAVKDEETLKQLLYVQEQRHHSPLPIFFFFLNSFDFQPPSILYGDTNAPLNSFPLV